MNGFINLVLFVSVAIISVTFCESANILYVVPFTSMSHVLSLRPLGLELARRGHNVTVITAVEYKNPPKNYHQVLADDKKIWDILEGGRPNVFTMVDLSAEEFQDKILWPGGLFGTEIALKSKNVQHFLNQDNKFDLVISEQFFQEAMYALAYKYNAPLALVTTFGNCMKHNILIRNPLQLATVIAEIIDVEDPESFMGRLRNLYFTAYEYFWWRYWYLDQQEELVKKYIPNLPQPVPGLHELQRDSSLILLNGHFSFDTPAAYLPNVVEVGGMHLSKSDEKLPQDLQEILDKSINGVVYVNFGSNVRSSELPEEKKNAFLKVFKELKETVLWKWEDDTLTDIPKNVVIRKWLPQKEILAHPNIKVFISHGGLIGTQEAIFNGLPIIGVPIYGDQYNNLLQAQENGFGKLLKYKDINENKLRETLYEVLKNDEYKKKAQEISRRFKDRPMSALDTAVYWIEYVIRNHGAEYMKNPARKLSWIAYNMVDVYAFFLSMLAIFVAVLFYIVRGLKSILVAKKVAKKHNKKHN